MRWDGAREHVEAPAGRFCSCVALLNHQEAIVAPEIPVLGRQLGKVPTSAR